MADYSGYVHPHYVTTFRPDWVPYYWGSSKSFNGRSETVVPAGYLGLLIDVYRDHLKNHGPDAERRKIKLTPRGWVLEGIALSWSKSKTEAYFGWGDRCPHSELKAVHDREKNKLYDVCLLCLKQICDHPVVSWTVTKTSAGRIIVTVGACENCGQSIDVVAPFELKETKI